MNIERLSRVRALAVVDSRGDGRIAKRGYLNIGILGAFPFGVFVFCKRLRLASEFAVTRRVRELVSQQRDASPASTVDLYADFVICPTQPFRAGSVQKAKVKSATHRRYVKLTE